MGENTEDIKKKASIDLSRNTPVALVVGAASFLGSHLVDGLLEKSIQVVGVDDLSSGKKEYLRDASGNKNFHFVIDSTEDVQLELVRLDYIFIACKEIRELEHILELLKKHKSRLLLLSSIELYDRESSEPSVHLMRHIESKIAKFSSENNLNVRVLRLGPVYGPRMSFKADFGVRDPVVRLLQQSLLNNLQKDISMEFSSRALYISDAVNLTIKAIFLGSTAQKIFDGVLPTPVKVSEIKQVLLDPLWYENREFSPSELPPWPTPNLGRTIKILHWHPKVKLVSSLRETLSYFKEVDVEKHDLEESAKEEVFEKRDQETKEWKKIKAKELESFKKIPEVRKRRIPFLSINKILLAAAIFLITYSIIWPAGLLGWGVLTFRQQLSEASDNLKRGEFEKSLDNISQAKFALGETKTILEVGSPLRRFKILRDQIALVDDFEILASLSADSAQSTVLGIKGLFQSLRAITGESQEMPEAYFTSSSVELTSANENLSRAFALINSEQFKKSKPSLLNSQIAALEKKLNTYKDLVKKARNLNNILPSIVALEGKKNYLILLQNNMELRPGGGFIGSFIKVSFEGGKLKNLEANDIYAIDGNLGLFVEPPKEIKEDLGQNRWFLRDSNWEPDFPTAARQAEWFYTKETGERVEGVVALDISAIQELLSVIGPLDLADYNEKITSENLFEKAISHAELSFFPGSQAKKSFLTALLNQVFNKLFFLPNQNWPGIVTVLGKSLEEKHMSVYLDDPKLFSYLVASNWAQVLPRPDQDSNSDFLALVEANLGANKANYYLDRSYSLETVVGKDGGISHKLRISYLNRSQTGAFPGGVYKNRMRIYLPFGSKLERALWSESNITPQAASFIDYGRLGYSILLELNPKEQKVLTLEYTVPIKLEFKDGRARYRVDVLKQAGILKDPFEWRITYPISYHLISHESKEDSPQELVVQTDLSKDRSFEVEFSN